MVQSRHWALTEVSWAKRVSVASLHWKDARILRPTAGSIIRRHNQNQMKLSFYQMNKKFVRTTWNPIQKWKIHPAQFHLIREKEMEMEWKMNTWTSRKDELKTPITLWSKSPKVVESSENLGRNLAIYDNLRVLSEAYSASKKNQKAKRMIPLAPNSTMLR